MENKLKQLKSFIEMLSITLGPFAEISLCDTKKYLIVENAIEKRKKVGDKISDEELYFINNKDFTKLPYVVNYKSLSSNMTKLRSSTFFIKNNETNKIENMITITVNVDSLIDVRELINCWINGQSFDRPTQSKEINTTPKLNLSLDDVIEEIIKEGEKRYNTTVSRMTMKEKQSLTREMFKRGVFLIKGSVSIASNKIGNSEATIYRYLKKLEKEEK